MSKEITVNLEEIWKIVLAGDSDAAMLYLCRLVDMYPNPDCMNVAKQDDAATVLTGLGIWSAVNAPELPRRDRPQYSDADIAEAMKEDAAFTKTVDEVTRRLGKVLQVWELRVLYSIHDYLRFSTEMIALLIGYCGKDKQSGQKVTLRAIEQEAYKWAELGINSPETACAYMTTGECGQKQTLPPEQPPTTEPSDNYTIAVKRILKIGNRPLVEGEANYIRSWYEMGMELDVVQMAYDEMSGENVRNIKYMNAILQRWHEKGAHNKDQMLKEPSMAYKQKRNKQSDFQTHGTPLSPMMVEAVRQMLAEEDET